jgi:hypothetical protein
MSGIPPFSNPVINSTGNTIGFTSQTSSTFITASKDAFATGPMPGNVYSTDTANYGQVIGNVQNK